MCMFVCVCILYVVYELLKVHCHSFHKTSVLLLSWKLVLFSCLYCTYYKAVHYVLSTHRIIECGDILCAFNLVCVHCVYLLSVVNLCIIHVYYFQLVLIMRQGCYFNVCVI